jgi:hypothetical protein
MLFLFSRLCWNGIPSLMLHAVVWLGHFDKLLKGIQFRSRLSWLIGGYILRQANLILLHLCICVLYYVFHRISTNYYIWSTTFRPVITLFTVCDMNWHEVKVLSQMMAYGIILYRPLPYFTFINNSLYIKGTLTAYWLLILWCIHFLLIIHGALD